MSIPDTPWPQQTPPAPLDTERVAPPPFPVPAAAAPSPPAFLKNPKLAAFLSLFPGMGNVYNGLYLRGLIQFLIVASLVEMLDRHGRPLFGLALAFFWIFNILDSYRQAVLINYGYSQDLGLLDRPMRPRPGQGGMVAGVLLFLVGLVAMLDQYFTISLDWLFDAWPIVMVLLGAWLIWGSIRDRRRASTPDA
jgi:hypothetical protein